MKRKVRDISKFEPSKARLLQILKEHCSKDHIARDEFGYAAPEDIKMIKRGILDHWMITVVMKYYGKIISLSFKVKTTLGKESLAIYEGVGGQFNGNGSKQKTMHRVIRSI